MCESPRTSVDGSPLDIHGREGARYISSKELAPSGWADFVETGLDVAVAVFGDNDGMK